MPHAQRHLLGAGKGTVGSDQRAAVLQRRLPRRDSRFTQQRGATAYSSLHLTAAGAAAEGGVAEGGAGAEPPALTSAQAAAANPRAVAIRQRLRQRRAQVHKRICKDTSRCFELLQLIDPCC